MPFMKHRKGPIFSGKMGYQGWILEDRLQGGRRIEYLLFIDTKYRHGHNAGGSNVVSDGVY